MALNTSSIPCDLLNNTSTTIPVSFTGSTTTFEDVWIPSSATVTKALGTAAAGAAPAVSGIIFNGTVMLKFSDVLTTTRLPSANTGKMLNTVNSSSTYRLISFLSNGGVAVPIVSGQRRGGAQTALTKIDYSLFSNILYKNGLKYLSIVDDFFMGSSVAAVAVTAGTTEVSAKNAVTGLGKASYTFSDTTNPDITDTNLTTLVTSLQTANYLLKETDLYPAGTGANPTPSSIALISLFQLVAQGTDLTAGQKDSLFELQTRNLRFFASFLAEYCFYRTRYDWFLRKYFDYYAMKAPDFITDSNKTSFYTAFSLSVADQTQPKLLEKIANQMAILNTRMIDMKRLLNAINQSYQTIFTNVQTTINSAGATVIGSNANVVAATQALSSSADSAEKYLSDAEFRKGIMDYTSEKNRYSNILLSFYAFLNIAALAAIFQLARS